MFAPRCCSTGSSPNIQFRGSRATPWLRSGHVATRDQCSNARRGTPRWSLFVGHGGGYHDHPNPLPLSAHSVPREVSCISSTLDEIEFSAATTTARFHNNEPYQLIGDRSGSPIRRDSRTMLDWCQGDPMESLAPSTLVPARGPAGSAIAAGRPPPALAVAPQPALCEG